MLMPSMTATVSGDDVENEREVSYAEDSDGFEMVSESSGFKINDQFSLSFDEGTITASYIADPVASPVRDWQLELSLEMLIGFEDNMNGIFDTGDTVVWTEETEDWTFEVSSDDTPLPDGGNLTKVTAKSEDSVLTLEFVFTTSPALAGDVPISPTEVKLNITIDLADVEGTFDMVALVISAETDIESILELEDQDDFEELNLTQDALGGFFSWSNNATVDGLPATVGSSWSEGDLTLAYPAGNTIVHDPIIGVRSVAPLSGLASTEEILGNPFVFAAGLAFASALVVGAVMVSRRKKS